LTLGRVGVDLGGGRYHVDRAEAERYVVGARGTVFDDVDWDAYYEQGTSLRRIYTPTDVLINNFAAAAYAVRGANGEAVCGPIATNPNLTAAQRLLVTPGCVPFNIFGEGSRSQAAYDYVLDESWLRTTRRQHVGAFNVRARPFDTWAGPVSAAAGIEARRDSVNVTSDALSQLSAHTLYNQQPYSGFVNVQEGYAEVLAPIAAGTAWAEQLDLDLAGRVTHYSTSGTVATWKVGVSWLTPVDIRFRGSRSRDIRAPGLDDLYTNGSFGAALNGAVNPFTGATGTLNSQTGGNRDLKPEIARTWTVGGVYQPNWMEGLGLSVDYYNIKMKDVIAQPGAGAILTECRNGRQDYCALIVTDTSAFGIAYVRSTPANIAERLVSGIDLEMNYRIDGTEIAESIPGEFSFRALGSYVEHIRSIDAGRITERAGSGVGGSPRWNWTIDTTYTDTRFSATLALRYFNKFIYDSTLVGPEDAGYDATLSNSVMKNRFPAMMYANLSLRYNVYQEGTRMVQLFGAVNNIMDSEPPKYVLVAFNAAGNPYNVMGRYFRGGVRFAY
jgi:outer membrane receptor protein involved in Fe transport